MLNVIYSRSETKRNLEIIKRIRESLEKNNGEVILLVPEQQVLEAERMTAGQGLVSFDFRVLSFRRLANEIFRCFGGLCERYLSAGASCVLMHRVLCELGGGLLEYGAIDLKDRSSITLLCNAVNEFKRAGVSSRELLEAGEKLSHTEKLKNKLSDLAMIMSAYGAAIQKGFGDPMDDLTRSAKLVNGTDFFKNVSVFVNSFDGFTGAELALLKLMIRDSQSVTVSLAMDLGDTSRFLDKIKRTDQALRSAARDVGAKVFHTKLPSDDIACAKELEFLCESLPDPEAIYEEANNAITVMPCKNVWDEVKYVASDILQKVKDGWDFSDIAIIMRSPESYAGILDAVFDACNIPLHFSVRSDVKKHPEIRMIFCALNVGAYGWKPDDVISYLRTGMSSLDLEKCDALEDYISLWKITGKNKYVKGNFTSHPDGFGHEITPNDAERLEYINKCRKELADPLSSFLDVFEKGSATARVTDICKALFEFLLKIDLKGQIEKSINELTASGKLSDAEEKRQVWNTVISSLDSLVDVAGDMSVDIKSFSMLFDTVIDTADIGKIPQGIGDVIASGPLLIRKSGLRHIYVLGVNEGVFPAVASEDVLLCDRERKRLLELGIDVFHDKEMRISDELYTFYRCLAMPKDSITLTYLATAHPSSLVEDIMRIFKIEKPKTFEISPKSTYTAFDAVRLASDMRSDALFDEIASKLEMSKSESGMSVGEESLSTQISHKLFSSHTVLSQSKLDSYSMCPYAFYCKYILKLRERAVSEAGSNTVGSFVHEILEKFFLEFNGRDMRTVTEKESKEALDRVLSKYNGGIISEDSTSRERGLYTRIERLVRLLTDNLRREFSVSAFAPYTFEMPIGRSGVGSDLKTVKALEIPVDEDFSVSLCGYIDRVDVLKKGDDAYVRVIDYKTGKKEFKKTDMELGINLQMPLYLKAFCEDENLRMELAKNGELLPAGVLYFAAGYPGIDSEDVDVTKSEDVYEKAVRSIKRNGLVFNDEEIIFAMDPEKKGEFIPVKYNKNGVSGNSLITKEEFEELQNTVRDTVAKKAKGMRDGCISATPIKEGGHDGCEYCPMRPVCRRFGD